MKVLRLPPCITAVVVTTTVLFAASSVHAAHTPPAPVFDVTEPPSPADYNTPVIYGYAEFESTVALYDNPSCTGTPKGTGPGYDFVSGMGGIQVSVPDDSSTTFYGTATHPPGSPSSCSASSITYIEVSTAPPPPTFTGTEPPSPADHNYPVIKGTATPGSDVYLFDNPSCTGSSGPSSTNASGSFAIPVSVPDNSTTTFYAKAKLAGFESNCSSSSITYVEITPPPPGPPPPPPCPPPEAPPGATYTGTHSKGGTVCFTVTGNWSHVTSFRVINDPCNEWFQVIFSAPVAPDRTFRARSPTTPISGAFDAGRGATGTYSDRDPFGGCDTGVLTWSASTTATPPWAAPVAVADKQAPGLRLRAKSSQRAVRQKGIVVEVGCPTEACTATALGSVAVPGAARTYRLKSTTKQIAKGGRAKLKLGLSKAALKAVKRALRRHRRVQARISVTIRDAAGNGTSQKRRIRLKR